MLPSGQGACQRPAPTQPRWPPWPPWPPWSPPPFDQPASGGCCLATVPPVPTTSIYSVGDGVVAWQTCCHDRPTRQVQDVEVQASHLGMGWNPRVLRVVADRLAQSPGSWRPYQTDAN